LARFPFPEDAATRRRVAAVLDSVQLMDIINAAGLTREHVATMNDWLDRGDGVAVYRNMDLGHPDVGHVQVVSFGSPDAQIEAAVPPRVLPDIGGQINYRYYLQGTYRGDSL
jgi:hypothetical protein